MAVRTFMLISSAKTDKNFDSAKGPAPILEVIDQAKVVSHLQEALQAKTISFGDQPADKNEFEKLHQSLRKNFPEVYKKLKNERVNDLSLLIEYPGTDAVKKPILFLAHMDVVPAGLTADWSHDPFAAKVADGFIWGRGAIDNKSNLLALHEALEILAKENFQPQRTVFVASGHDEEVGGSEGAKQIAGILKSRGIQLEAVNDEGAMILEDMVKGMTKPVAMIGLAEKGYMTAFIKSHGTGGHSSMPSKDSAIAKLAQVALYIKEHLFSSHWRGVAEKFFLTLAPHMGMKEKIAFANMWALSPVMLTILSGDPSANALIRTTSALTMVQAGVKENVLPDSATLTVNFRVHPVDGVDKVRLFLDQIASQFDVEYTLNQKAFNNPSRVSNPETEFFKSAAAEASRLYPDALVVPSMVIAGTDTVHFAEIADNIYRFTPIQLAKADLKQIHGIDEKISIEQYKKLITYYYNLIKKVAGS